MSHNNKTVFSCFFPSFRLSTMEFCSSVFVLSLLLLVVQLVSVFQLLMRIQLENKMG